MTAELPQGEIWELVLGIKAATDSIRYSLGAF